MKLDPAEYEAWYHTPRGRWIAGREAALLLRLLRPQPGASLLDAGCGTGHFSRRFAQAGLSVTGVDPDPAMLAYARTHSAGLDLDYVRADARALPFPDASFDYIAAVTSLCFVPEPARALQELWRVSRRGLVLGLLNRRSLLYRGKHGRGSYRGARWDDWREVRQWLAMLEPLPVYQRHRTAIFLPGGGLPARLAEALLPGGLPWGGFLAVCLRRDNG
ncbi:class I SAM-dependent methyltransferase [Thiohalobacter thiocyanaticus]|uniref:Class I SAM-dependent methyltransferase n=1 Tax=Thiohalobacter thiocyanaticus TaxID=585455 RepID=A0A426QKV9_9GAMM|nr:class I SAM-dependent methyltransferase [Thiohalobacter thiocyanaticus]RRQ22392.1 class I SAM-dependent methyltransferase [Thiohalobacter thiocyanaticus]